MDNEGNKNKGLLQLSINAVNKFLQQYIVYNKHVIDPDNVPDAQTIEEIDAKVEKIYFSSVFRSPENYADLTADEYNSVLPKIGGAKNKFLDFGEIGLKSTSGSNRFTTVKIDNDFVYRTGSDGSIIQFKKPEYWLPKINALCDIVDEAEKNPNQAKKFQELMSLSYENIARAKIMDVVGRESLKYRLIPEKHL